MITTGKKTILFLALLATLIFFIYPNKSSNEAEKIVNVYGWYGVIPREVLRGFEKETGIKVVYDLYDNNDSLEAKLLATNSGYDIVFPTFIPYAARQVKMGAYIKLDANLLSNLKNIAGSITNKFKEAGGDTDYVLPIFWSTIGIAFESRVIKKIFPNEKIRTYDMLLNPEKISKLSSHGVSFPEEYVDIFPQTKCYLKIGDEEDKLDAIKKCITHFKGIRKYITKFSGSTLISDLLSGDICIAIGPSDNAYRAIQAAPNVGKKVKYVLPRDAGMLAIDCVGIPRGAPHIANAHKFLNYIMKPEIAAKITNSSGILVNVPSAIKLFDSQITSNDQICPTDPKVLNALIVGAPNQNAEDIKCDKAATRFWSQIRMNAFEDIKFDELNEDAQDD